MRGLVLAAAILFGFASAARGTAPAPLTTLRAIHALSNAEAASQPPVAFEATVTYRRAGETTLFVQDGDAAIYVWVKAETQMAPGDRVLIKGIAKQSFRPIVVSDSVTVLRHGALPRPVPATFDELIHSERDCMRVTVRGHAQSADLILSNGQLTNRIQLLVNGGAIAVYISSGNAKFADELLDAEVEVTGVATAQFDGKMQQTGVSLSVLSLADVKILKPAGTNPWSLPVTQMDEIIGNYHVDDLSRRVRIHGTITFYQPGTALVVQSGAKSIWVATKREEPLRVGSEADVTGFPDTRSGFLALENGEVQQTDVYAPIAPRPVTRSDLTSSKNIFDLVSIEGQVVAQIRESAQDEYVLVADGQVFSAIYRHSGLDGERSAPMKYVPLGSRVRVTGICNLENSNPFGREVPFDILLRTPDDIVVVAQPSLLNIRNLILVVCGLLLVVFAVLGRGWALERKVRRQTAALAHIEHRRSQILEDINGSRPLAEIIEEITELASFQLHGAPCWCQIADGARLGNCPAQLTALRVVQCEIPARSGLPLGAIFAAFDPLTKPSGIELETLSAAVGLATLAIETRRLYSDLLHRSEFDLLTDSHNRFSLEKQLDAQIEQARQNASIFGLVYIDLDEFKQVNDLYGHHIGDLYLQEVALRMKRALRPHDLLARLGGDEFAVLLPKVRSRADVEEIAQRLEHSFDAPLALQGHALKGAASFGIALYPEDGATREALLSIADAAMYAVKSAKHEIGTEREARRIP